MKQIILLVIFLGGLLIGFCPVLSAQTTPSSKEANTFYDRGLKYFDQKRFEDAIAEFSRAINLNSQNPTFFRLRAVAKERNHDLPGALTDYTRAIGLDANYASAYNGRGVVKKRLRDFKGALADYNRALELKATRQSQSIYFANRAELKYLMEDYEGALVDVNQAIELNPDYAPPYTMRGYMKLRKDDVEGALADHSRALEYRSQAIRGLPQPRTGQAQDQRFEWRLN